MSLRTDLGRYRFERLAARASQTDLAEEWSRQLPPGHRRIDQTFVSHLECERPVCGEPQDGITPEEDAARLRALAVIAALRQFDFDEVAAIEAHR